MATVTLDRIVYTRVTEQDLGAGRKSVATVTATGVNVAGEVTKSSTIALNTPSSNLTETELTAYQTFIGGLDEIATELEAALYVEEGG